MCCCCFDFVEPINDMEPRSSKEIKMTIIIRV
jgi:hypothetical protein